VQSYAIPRPQPLGNKCVRDPIGIDGETFVGPDIFSKHKGCGLRTPFYVMAQYFGWCHRHCHSPRDVEAASDPVDTVLSFRFVEIAQPPRRRDGPDAIR
jgi:hypothetical protein